MRTRAHRLTDLLQNEYDPKLVAKSKYGRIDILRKGFRYVPYEINGQVILVLNEDNWPVLSLTNNWKNDGRPVEWGVEPILAKLRSMDLWKRNIADEAIKAKEKKSESQERGMDNNLEAFWKDNRRLWAKNFDQVNRSNISRPDRRFRDDKILKLKGK
jgi:hypothetical protein